MDRNQEEYVFNAFKNKYLDFPVGEIVRTEQPDFILKTANQTIGLEITQVFIDNHLDPQLNLKRKESIRCLLGERLCKELSLVFPFKFALSIDFSQTDFTIRKIYQIVSECVLYFKSMDLANKANNLTVIENIGQIPEEIESISLFPLPTLHKSFYSECDAGVLPTLSMLNLKPILDKKEQALKKYQACDQNWLLIEEGTFMSDSFGDVSIQEFQTDFHKVFLYRHAHNKVLELK